MFAVMRDDALRAVAELAASQHRAFTRHQAAALSFNHRRIATAVRRGWLVEPVPGVLVIVGSPATWQQRLMVAVLASDGHAVVSHRAAARLHRLDGFDRAGMAVVEASVTRAHRLVLPSSVCHHVTPLDDEDCTIIDGLPCTTVARTLADLGAVIHDRNLLRRALTAARRRGVAVEVIRRTVERLHRPGPTGTGPMLRLLDGVPCEGRVPDSWFEELVAACVADRALPPFEMQYPIVDARGRLIARADIGFPSVKLGLEAHSREFHFGPLHEPLDEQRDLAAAACGWELLYLGWYAAKRPAEVLAAVRAVIAARRREAAGQSPAVPSHSEAAAGA